MALCRSSAVTAQIEEYDFPGFDKATSIAQIGEDRVAWFKDSEGNLLPRERHRPANAESAIRRWGGTHVQLCSVVGAGYRFTIGIADMRGHRLKADHDAGRPGQAFCTPTSRSVDRDRWSPSWQADLARARGRSRPYPPDGRVRD